MKSIPITLTNLMKLFSKGPLHIKMEHRIKLGYYTYGIINQGELPKYINTSDQDKWDVIIPGYSYKIRKENFHSNDIIGIYLLKNGNHKIFMRISHPGFDSNRSKKDIQTYLENYYNTHNIPGIYSS